MRIYLIEISLLNVALEPYFEKYYFVVTTSSHFHSSKEKIRFF